MGAPYGATLHIERPSSCTRCGYIKQCIGTTLEHREHASMPRYTMLKCMLIRTLLCTLHVYGCTLWDHPAHRAPKLLHTMRIYHTMYINANGTPRTCCNPEIFQVDIHNININLLCTLHVYGCTLWGHPAHRAPKLLHTMRVYYTMYMNAIGTPRTCCNAEIYHVDIHNIILMCILHVYRCT
jgi:hypothetical protein